MSITQEPHTRLDTQKSTKRGSRTRPFQPDTPFLGVRKRKWGRYVSEIRLPGKKTRIWLGSFRSPEMAARAYDTAAFFLKGNTASLNFPELVGSLPRPESCSRKDIQVAAAKAAALAEPSGNQIELDWFGLGGEVDCSGCWGLVDDGEFTTSFDEVKEAPLLSPLRLELDSSLCPSGELYYNSMDMAAYDDDDEFLLGLVNI